MQCNIYGHKSHVIRDRPNKTVCEHMTKVTVSISYNNVFFHFQSVSSGSLLLSAAHLARMHGRSAEQDEVGSYHTKLGSYGRKSGHSEAVVAIPEESHDGLDSIWNGVKRSSGPGQDTQSIASSTHFTVVNGYTKHRTGKEPKSCCCDHSHQITVLVISMTILFSACILAAICFVESEYSS